MFRELCPRGRNMKYLILIISAVIIVLVIFWMGKAELSPVGTLLSEEKLIKDLKILTNEKLEIENMEVWPNGLHPNVTIKNIDGSIDKNSKIILINTSIKRQRDNFTGPFEVENAMRIWLHLKERTPPYPINGVYVSVKLKGIISPLHKVLISESEFDGLYQEISKHEINQKQIVEQLSYQWVTNNKYNQWWEK
jgi:hypothetical protein